MSLRLISSRQDTFIVYVTGITVNKVYMGDMTVFQEFPGGGDDGHDGGVGSEPEF